MNVHNSVLTNNCCIENPPTHGVLVRAASVIRRMRATLAKRRARRLDRKALRSLLTMDDKMLKDIGVSRGDVQWASQLPLSASATAELEIVSRRGKRMY